MIFPKVIDVDVSMHASMNLGTHEQHLREP